MKRARAIPGLFECEELERDVTGAHRVFGEALQNAMDTQMRIDIAVLDWASGVAVRFKAAMSASCEPAACAGTGVAWTQRSGHPMRQLMGQKELLRLACDKVRPASRETRRHVTPHVHVCA